MSPTDPNTHFTIGILGGGQLGQMLTQAAHELGHKVHIFCPEAGCPASQVSDAFTCAEYTDEEVLKKFAAEVDLVSLEFENIPVVALDVLEPLLPVRPGRKALHTAQHRLREKTFFAEHRFPVAPFRHVKSEEELHQAIEELGTPCVLKTAGFGYDGKGQVKIQHIDECAAAWATIEGQEAVLEAWMLYTDELSILAARNVEGETRCYPLVHNVHTNHILDVSVIPAKVSDAMEEEAEAIAVRLLTELEYCGVLAIEFFRMRDGRLIINEMAPRVHNSGHVTMDAAETSQFEQHIRAVCGMPLGSAKLKSPGAMVNILGDAWHKGEPDWDSLKEDHGLSLYLYGKAEARPGRKMGHFNVVANSADAARKIAADRRQRL